MKKKPKNKAAQALAALRKPENMARTSEQARHAALVRWSKKKKLPKSG